MGLQPLTSSINPVSLADAKTQLRLVDDLVDTDDIPYGSDDAALNLILPAALEWIEAETRQQLCTRQYIYTLDGFPGQHRTLARESLSFDRFGVERSITLPKPPLQSVASVQYVDQAGTLQTLNSSNYTVDVTTRPGRIVLNPGNSWPQTSNIANAVRITLTAGYGDAGDVPMILRQAITLLTGSWYEQRFNDITLRINSIPIGVQSIVAQTMFPECVG